MENSTAPTEPDIIICECAGTTEAKIKQLIADGADSLDRIARITGACTGCGSCDVLIEDLLEQA